MQQIVTRIFQKLTVLATSFLISVVPSIADDTVTFDENQLYSIRNKATGTSMILGAPNEDVTEEVYLGPGFGGAMFRRGETGWQIISPCGGLLSCNWKQWDFRFIVQNESYFEVEVTPEGDFYTLTSTIHGELQYFGAEYSDIRLFEKYNENTPWEIIPLPAGAIIDVPQRIEMTNRTFGSGVSYDPNYYATNVELSDDMGFACAHDVVAETLTFTRELKEGLQGFCAPIALDMADWEPFGKLYRIGEAVEETDADGKPTISLNLVEAEKFEPNKPYLLKVEHPGTLSVNKSECVVSPSGTIEPDVAETANARFELSCVYDFTEVPYTTSADTQKAYALSGGVFKRPASAGVKLKPYRVMLTVTSTGDAPARIALKTGRDEEVTIIETVETESTQQQWYDLSGRPATPSTRGLLISPSHKTIKR